jgi:hypothetical protein
MPGCVKFSVFKCNLQCAKFEVLMTATMKIFVFWDVAPYSLVDCYQIFRRNPSSSEKSHFWPEVGGSTVLRNVGNDLPYYTVSRSRKH